MNIATVGRKPRHQWRVRGIAASPLKQYSAFRILPLPRHEPEESSGMEGAHFSTVYRGLPFVGGQPLPAAPTLRQRWGSWSSLSLNPCSGSRAVGSLFRVSAGGAYRFWESENSDGSSRPRRGEGQESCGPLRGQPSTDPQQPSALSQRDAGRNLLKTVEAI
jgi:hypothetical protein